MLQIKNLTVSYGDKQVLGNASLACSPGEITTLLGVNGSGKSTLLKAVVGIVPCAGGEICVEGLPAGEMREKTRAQKIAYLAQGKNIPDITVGRLVLHGRFPYLSYPRKYRSEDYAIAAEAMRKMGVSEYADLPLRALSGGMRQKVYLAMALCQRASVILLDEPTTYLDISQQFRLHGTLRELAAEGKTILTVSHDIIGALKVSDRLAVLRDGTIAAADTPSGVLRSGILSGIFGIEIRCAEFEGRDEYFYRAAKEEPRHAPSHMIDYSAI